MLSGHEHNGNAGEARRTDNNSCGQPVQQIMTDYQDRANGGDGWLRYYTFNPAAGTMTATTYSPKLGIFETDADSAFTLPFPLGTQVPAPFAPIATATVASGATAQTSLGRPRPRHPLRVARDGQRRHHDDDLADLDRAHARPDSASSTTPSPARSRTAGASPTAGRPGRSSSTASAYSVDGNRGRMTLPAGTGRAARLATVSLADVASRRMSRSPRRRPARAPTSR